MLGRWAWERKGKPDVLRETIPFWVVFGVATAISTLATKLGYHMAAPMHLHGLKHVLIVEGVYFVANVVTFLMRLVIFHYLLFADRTTDVNDAATGPDIPAPGTHSHRQREAPEPAAPGVTAMSPPPSEARCRVITPLTPLARHSREQIAPGSILPAKRR